MNFVVLLQRFIQNINFVDLHFFLHLYISGCFNVFLQNDGETTTLARGMHGLFEPVFPLTTNKYRCQSVSVYLACLSAMCFPS